MSVRPEFAVTLAVPLQTFQPRPRENVPASELIALARSRAPDDRQRLLLGVAALCDSAPPGAELSPVLTEIFLTLARQAEHDIRRALSENLAGSTWAPPALINMLALDEIEIARPIISSSPLLKDQDLLRILVEASIEHQIEVARRPALSGRVADAIIDGAEPATMTALASNRSAEISDDGLRRLIEQSRRVAALRAPLTRHPRLNHTLATQLYAFVGQALRQAIGERFRVDDVAMAEAIDAAVMTARPGPPPDASPTPDPALREEMDRRLVDKLQSAGQLRAGLLVRAVREKRLGLFEHALSSLGGFSVTQVRASIMRPAPDALYLACTSVGIDRAVFPAMLLEIRKLNGGWPGTERGEWDGVTLAPSAAARAFRDLMGGRV